jgi:hypothetical protein
MEKLHKEVSTIDEMESNIRKYVCIEIGNSAYTEYKMRSGEFEATDDGIFLGTVIAKDESDAIRQVKGTPGYENRSFDKVIAFEIVPQ